jgi:hypothetical protein
VAFFPTSNAFAGSRSRQPELSDATANRGVRRLAGGDLLSPDSSSGSHKQRRGIAEPLFHNDRLSEAKKSVMAMHRALRGAEETPDAAGDQGSTGRENAVGVHGGENGKQPAMNISIRKKDVKRRKSEQQNTAIVMCTGTSSSSTLPPTMYGEREHHSTWEAGPPDNMDSESFIIIS